MNANEAEIARTTYSYVPARLRHAAPEEMVDLVWEELRMCCECPTSEAWNAPHGRENYASRKLDEYHSLLLNSEAASDQLVGLASTVFWGFASGAGTTVRHTPERALARAGMLANGHARALPQPREEIIDHLSGVKAELAAGSPENALREALRIKFLGMAFASKLVMFFDPNQAAVYDFVIAQRLSNSEDQRLRRMAVSVSSSTSRASQCRAYGEWCAYCAERANQFNMQRAKWTDWDGVRASWRAVDVERAFFALGRA